MSESSWDTGEVYNWLANTEAAYRYVMKLASDLTPFFNGATGKAKGLAAILEEMIPKSGYIQASLNWEKVDWREVAEALLTK